MAYKKNKLQKTRILQVKQPCKKNNVSSQLLFAAYPRLWPRKRGKAEGNWSLLSRAEAQNHLYVIAILISCFDCPATCNREENSF